MPLLFEAFVRSHYSEWSATFTKEMIKNEAEITTFHDSNLFSASLGKTGTITNHDREILYNNTINLSTEIAVIEILGPTFKLKEVKLFKLETSILFLEK